MDNVYYADGTYQGLQGVGGFLIGQRYKLRISMENRRDYPIKVQATEGSSNVVSALRFYPCWQTDEKGAPAFLNDFTDLVKREPPARHLRRYWEEEAKDWRVQLWELIKVPALLLTAFAIMAGIVIAIRILHHAAFY